MSYTLISLSAQPATIFLSSHCRHNTEVPRGCIEMYISVMICMHACVRACVRLYIKVVCVLKLTAILSSNGNRRTLPGLGLSFGER